MTREARDRFLGPYALQNEIEPRVGDSPAITALRNRAAEMFVAAKLLVVSTIGNFSLLNLSEVSGPVDALVAVAGSASLIGTVYTYGSAVDAANEAHVKERPAGVTCGELAVYVDNHPDFAPHQITPPDQGNI